MSIAFVWESVSWDFVSMSVISVVVNVSVGYECPVSVL